MTYTRIVYETWYLMQVSDFSCKSLLMMAWTVQLLLKKLFSYPKNNTQNCLDAPDKLVSLQILLLPFLSLTTYARYQTLEILLPIFPQPLQLPNGSSNLLRRYSTGLNPVTGAVSCHQWFEGLEINQLTPQWKRSTVVKFPETLYNKEMKRWF